MFRDTKIRKKLVAIYISKVLYYYSYRQPMEEKASYMEGSCKYTE
jgi:hypothetical protein